jgi:hypothetical protein
MHTEEGGASAPRKKWGVIRRVLNQEYLISGGSNFSKIWEPSRNYRRQKGDTK